MNMFIAISTGQLPALLVAYFLMSSDFFSIRIVLILGITCFTLLFLCVYFWKQDVVVFSITAFNFIYIIYDVNLKSYATETYNINLKTQGLLFIDIIGSLFAL